MHDLENRPMTRMSPRRSHRLRIAMAVAMAMLMAGCGSSPEAGPTEPSSKVDAGTTTPRPASVHVRRRRGRAPSRTGSTATSTWPTGTARTRSGSRTAVPQRVRPRPGRGEYWGEGPIWSPDGRYLAYRHTNCDGPEDAWRDVAISDPQGNVVAGAPPTAGRSHGRPTPPGLRCGSPSSRRSACSGSTASGRRCSPAARMEARAIMTRCGYRTEIARVAGRGDPDRRKHAIQAPVGAGDAHPMDRTSPTPAASRS